MQSSSIIAIMAFATGITAENCKPNVDYCGHVLVKVGKYQGQMDQALAAAGRCPSGGDVLFHCVGGSNGVITFKQDRGYSRCINGGSGSSDFCV